jgi:hypothetical protein
MVLILSKHQAEEAEEKKFATEFHGRKKNRNKGLNKRGQVSFSALTIFYSWFGLTAEKET